MDSLGQNVSEDGKQEVGNTEKRQPQVEVVEDGEAAGLLRLSGESSSEEKDSGDEFDSDDDPDFEITIETLEISEDNAPRAEAKGDETSDTTDAEKRIEELEKRLRQKLEDAGHGAQKSKREEKTVKGKGFTSKRIGASKQSLPKGNNVAAVTHGLKKTERAFMTGVLEKYGQVPRTTKS
ncbi:hypothetical protein GOP47_0013120 [Adiantum capillus-veneris]|nr:hypothetical protein GOP47_0013120 [Adiantum capillus-veneris]